MPQFLVLARDAFNWSEMSAQEQQGILHEYFTWDGQQKARGIRQPNGAPPMETGKVLRRAVIGPLDVAEETYADPQEILGGFWILEAADLIEAMNILSDHPHLRFGSVVVRQIVRSELLETVDAASTANLIPPPMSLGGGIRFPGVRARDSRCRRGRGIAVPRRSARSRRSLR